MVDLFAKAINIDSNNLPTRTESIKRYLNRKGKRKVIQLYETISVLKSQFSIILSSSFGPLQSTVRIKLVIRLVLSVRNFPFEVGYSVGVSESSSF